MTHQDIKDKHKDFVQAMFWWYELMGSCLDNRICYGSSCPREFEYEPELNVSDNQGLYFFNTFGPIVDLTDLWPLSVNTHFQYDPLGI